MQSSCSLLIYNRVCLCLAYSGQNFHGFQAQPGQQFRTVEGELKDAFAAAGLLSTLGQAHWSRAARTDRGVSAAANVVALDIALKEEDGSCPDSLCRAIHQRLAACLPGDIAALAVLVPISPHFDARKCCIARRYDYVLPLWALDPQVALPRHSHILGIENSWQHVKSSIKTCSGKKEWILVKEQLALHDTQGSRLHADPEAMAAKLGHLNKALATYVGHHSFHNFACTREVARGVNCQRTIHKCEASLEVSDLPLVRITLTGSSFMMHQIRKMVGLAVAVARGSAECSSIVGALQPSRQCTVPTAPGAGLVMVAALYEPGIFMSANQGSFGLLETTGKNNDQGSAAQWLGPSSPALTAQGHNASQSLSPTLQHNVLLELYNFVRALPSHDYTVVPSTAIDSQRRADLHGAVNNCSYEQDSVHSDGAQNATCGKATHKPRGLVRQRTGPYMNDVSALLLGCYESYGLGRNRRPRTSLFH